VLYALRDLFIKQPKTLIDKPIGAFFIYERSSAMNENKITALYERLSKGDKERQCRP
jgi:hypothetical protein